MLSYQVREYYEYVNKKLKKFNSSIEIILEFGNQYKEILHMMSFQDKKQVNEIMEIVDDAFSFIGNKEIADSKYGELSRYCITQEDAVTEKHDLKLITADFNKNKGYLWFVYNQEALDNNNQTTMGSWDILVRVTLEKINQDYSKLILLKLIMCLVFGSFGIHKFIEKKVIIGLILVQNLILYCV